jgi:hypothetical protein
MSDPQPVWKVTTRAEAIEILRASRARTEALITELDEKLIKTRTVLGGGNWSVKDHIGHLASWEERALAAATEQPPRYPLGQFSTADEFNAAEFERKRDWSLAKVRKDSEQIRTALLEAIESMDDEKWKSKVQLGEKRSALALILGRILAGDRYGLFAHDLAHLKDLEKSVKALRA